MSATVTYKGSTLGTAENATLTLNTSGTYMEDDVTITDVTSGGSATIESLSVTANGTYTAPSGVDGYSPVTVNVSSSSTLGTKSITANGTYTASDDGYDGYSSVTVAVSGGGGYDINDIATNTEPSGAITIDTATTIEEYAFNRKWGITGITAPYVTRIKQYAFEQVGKTSGATVTSSSFPSLTTVDASAFRASCFTSIEITNSAALLKNTAPFGYTNYLRTALFPNNTGIVGSMCFYQDRGLNVVDVGYATSISANAFNSCPITALIIRTESVCALANTNAFNSSSFASGGTGGSIYVPSDLISSYQTASNWSTIHGYGTITWVALEGSQYE